MDYCWNSFVSNDRFWYHINSKTFPKLLHLTIGEYVNDIIQKKLTSSGGSENINIISNVSSLVANRLKSLHIRLNGLKWYDLDLKDNGSTADNTDNEEDNRPRNSFLIDQFLATLAKMFEKKNDAKDENKTSKSFILKIELSVYLSSKDDSHKRGNQLINESQQPVFDVICVQLLTLYTWLVHQYNNVMCGFKLYLNYGSNFSQSYLKEGRNLLEARFKDQIVFQSDKMRTVETVIKQDYPDKELMFGAIIKNRYLGKENVSCQSCYMEPKYPSPSHANSVFVCQNT